MGAGEFSRQNPDQGHLVLWQKRHPCLYGLSWVFIWSASMLGKFLSIIFATWPSMHDPINHLLNAADPEEADKLTEKWTDGKLKELQYVGTTVRKTEHTNFLHISAQNHS